MHGLLPEASQLSSVHGTFSPLGNGHLNGGHGFFFGHGGGSGHGARTICGLGSSLQTSFFGAFSQQGSFGQHSALRQGAVIGISTSQFSFNGGGQGSGHFGGGGT
jgi:hypothetical protein